MYYSKHSNLQAHFCSHVVLVAILKFDLFTKHYFTKTHPFYISAWLSHSIPHNLGAPFDILQEHFEISAEMQEQWCFVCIRSPRFDTKHTRGTAFGDVLGTCQDHHLEDLLLFGHRREYAPTHLSPASVSLGARLSHSCLTLPTTLTV
jgi:hypothetical protein